MKKSFFKDYNYKKHAMVCSVVYGSLFAFDMSVSYFILKKLFAKMQAEGKLED